LNGHQAKKTGKILSFFIFSSNQEGIFKIDAESFAEVVGCGELWW